MSRRFFTADFHLNMPSILEFERRPFSSIDDMNTALLKQCEQTPAEDDIIIHVGDLACFGGYKDNNTQSSSRVCDLFKNVKANFINIRGNHDINNKVISVCESMTVHLGKKYPNVVIGHYPSYDIRAMNYVKNGWICICGHVHGRWKHCLDMNRQVLNINVGVDVWKYKLVPENELCAYIGKLLTHRPDDLYRCFMSKGKLKFQEGKYLI